MKDNFERKIEYLRLSLTDACNLKCAYCKKSGKPVRQLNLADVEKLLPAFKKAGIKKIRLTGGEPLLYPHIADVVSLCKATGFEDIALTTNALLLKDKAQILKSCGLNRVNISLNSLKEAVYANITGVDGLNKVLEGIKAAEEAGLYPIKINVVLMRGKNDNEATDFIELTKNKPYHVRFIEYMPMGADIEGDNIRITQDDILKQFPFLYRCEAEDTAAARVYRAEGYMGSIGFISPVSKPFCGSCTRMRVTSAMTLRPCLGNNLEMDLRTALDEGNLSEIIEKAIKSKPQQGFCRGFETVRPMSQIGG